MPRFTFDNKITLGGVIQIGLLLFAILGAYFGIVSKVESSAKDISGLQQTIGSMASLAGRVDTIETRINIGQRAREQFQDETKQQLSELQKQNTAILQAIARLETIARQP